MNRRRILLFLATLIFPIAALEIILRLSFGLGNPVLVQRDPQTGYRFQPNQRLSRFGKAIAYNQYSQRSEAIASPKPSNTLRILMTGDSVLNGGTPIAQTETISEQLEAQLSRNRKTVEVLNASAGSWGIGNQLGYIRKFGLFDSDLLILQIGTHDLTQPTSTGDRVGNDPNYPQRPPILALQELWARYLFPRLALKFNRRLPTTEIPLTENSEEQLRKNLEMLREIVAIARQNKTPVLVLYTPNWTDVLPEPSQPPHKAEFVRVLAALQVPLIDLHAAWSNWPKIATVQSYFRDSVHLTASGNQMAVRLLAENPAIASP
ncbi:MAG: SGNH/GDSL hydrolase family protein [Cyanobacteriota bacterium]|nr:SGNH/GDSL hydrolase family protein [Cyanobacteriota bacterium]